MDIPQKLIAFSAMALSPAISSPAWAAPAPPNTVRCVIDALTEEDREIAMLLMVITMARGGEIEESDEYKEVGALIDDGERQCASRWKWNSTTKSVSRSYAEIELLRQTYMQMLAATGRDAKDVDTHFSLNRSQLGQAYMLSSRHYDALDAALEDKGWEDEDDLALAHVYLDMLWTQERLTRQFNAVRG